MSSVERMPELATALDGLVPLEDGLRADWDDVVGRVGSRRRLWLIRGRHPRLRLAVVVALLLLLLTGVATATYLVVRGNGGIALGGGTRLLVANPNGHGLQVVAYCAAGPGSCALAEPAFSPDGKHLAFIGGRDLGPMTRSHLSLYVATASGRDHRRLARCGGCGVYGGSNLTWSPNGRWIAFARDARRQESLWIVAAGGGKLRRLTDCHSPCADYQPAWSPDGKRLVFTHSVRTPGASGIYTIRPDGSGLTKIANGWGNPKWSPDGRRVVFDSGPDGIAVVDAGGSHLHVLLAGARGSGPGAPSWSPDGHRLVYFNTPRGHCQPSHSCGGQSRGYLAEVWTMNPDGSGKERLYRSGCCVGYWAPPIWAPNGQLIAFSADSAGGTFVINANGTDLRRLSPTAFSELSWQPLLKGAQSDQQATRPLVIPAQSAWNPYRMPSTRSCLARHHARLRTTTDTLSISQIQWVLARNSYGPSVWITISFLPDPADAEDYERSDKSTLRTTEVVGSAWIRHHVTRLGNVVVENAFRGHPLTAAQLATIDGCLRR